MGRSYVGETTRRRSLEAKAGSQTETRQTTGGEGLDDSVGKGPAALNSIPRIHTEERELTPTAGTLE